MIERYFAESKDIYKKSLLNCHAKGLHSLMLVDEPEARIRIFYAEPNHELYRNMPGYNGTEGMAVGFHPHHCYIKLIPILGIIYNWMVKLNEQGELAMDEFLYDSSIIGNGTGFRYQKKARLTTHALNVIGPNQMVGMNAHKLHTVGVRKNACAAWIVREGKEDFEYKPLCYSNANLERASFAELYQKPNRTTIDNLKAEILNQIQTLGAA